MTLASWFSHGLGFWDDRKCWFFPPHKQFCQRFGFTIWVYRRSFSRDPSSRWEPKQDPYHSHTNRRDSKMGVKTPTSEGVWQLKKAYALSIGWHSPFFKKELMKGGEQRTEWNAGGDFSIGISTTYSQLIVLQNCWRQHPGVIKLPIFAGHQT